MGRLLFNSNSNQLHELKQDLIILQHSVVKLEQTVDLNFRLLRDINQQLIPGMSNQGHIGGKVWRISKDIEEVHMMVDDLTMRIR